MFNAGVARPITSSLPLGPVHHRGAIHLEDERSLSSQCGGRVTFRFYARVGHLVVLRRDSFPILSVRFRICFHGKVNSARGRAMVPA